MGTEHGRPLERLLDESWDRRSQPATRRTLVVESVASVLFLAVAIPMAVSALSTQHLRLGVAALLVALYALFSRSIKIPIGAGSFVPTYLVLVPMLVLLPPGAVPLLAALGLVVGTIGRWAARRTRLEQVLWAIPDAWHTVGPAVVLVLAGYQPGGSVQWFVYPAAFAAACLVDLVASTLREWLSGTVHPVLQMRVIGVVWAVDACMAPLGLLVAYAARRNAALLLLLLPLSVLLMIINRDRQVLIAERRRRLRLLALEHERVQTAAQRVGEALVAKLDAAALDGGVLQPALDAVSAASGSLVLGHDLRPIFFGAGAPAFRQVLDAASTAAWSGSTPYQLESDETFVIAAPLMLQGRAEGAIALARRGHSFGEAEREALQMFVERAERAASDIHQFAELRRQAVTDPLTGVGNRRKLAADLIEQLERDQPLALALFDLDGFKLYNDSFGHPAGDAMLSKLAGRLISAVSPYGSAYRVGGDEFCVLTTAECVERLPEAGDALTDAGPGYEISSSCGSVLLPSEAATPEDALLLADKRMYQHKRERGRSADRSMP